MEITFTNLDTQKANKKFRFAKTDAKVTKDRKSDRSVLSSLLGQDWVRCWHYMRELLYTLSILPFYANSPVSLFFCFLSPSSPCFFGRFSLLPKPFLSPPNHWVEADRNLFSCRNKVLTGTDSRCCWRNWFVKIRESNMNFFEAVSIFFSLEIIFWAAMILFYLICY